MPSIAADDPIPNLIVGGIAPDGIASDPGDLTGPPPVGSKQGTYETLVTQMGLSAVSVFSPSAPGRLFGPPLSADDLMQFSESWCSGLNPADISGSTWTNQSGTDFTLNGNWWEVAGSAENDYGQQGDTTHRSIAAWMRVDAATLPVAGGDQMLFGQTTSTLQTTPGWGVFFNHSTRRVSFSYGDGTNGNYMSLLASSLPVMPATGEFLILFTYSARREDTGSVQGYANVTVIDVSDGSVVANTMGDGLQINGVGAWSSIPTIQIPSAASGIDVLDFGIVEWADVNTLPPAPAVWRYMYHLMGLVIAGIAPEYVADSTWQAREAVDSADSFLGVDIPLGAYITTPDGGANPTWELVSDTMPLAWSSQGYFASWTIPDVGTYALVPDGASGCAWWGYFRIDPRFLDYEGDVLGIYGSGDGYVELYHNMSDSVAANTYIGVYDDEGTMVYDDVISQPYLDALRNLALVTPGRYAFLSCRLIRSENLWVFGVNGSHRIFTVDATTFGTFSDVWQDMFLGYMPIRAIGVHSEEVSDAEIEQWRQQCISQFGV